MSAITSTTLVKNSFLGGGALVSCSTSTPINHIVLFFLQNTSCFRKPQVISGAGGGGGVHPLHPSPRFTPVFPSPFPSGEALMSCIQVFLITINFVWGRGGQ